MLLGYRAHAKIAAMPRFSFSLKSLLIAVVCAAILMKFWPPYIVEDGESGRPPGFNPRFLKVAGIEAFVVLVVWLVGKADEALREFDEPPCDEEDPSRPT